MTTTTDTRTALSFLNGYASILIGKEAGGVSVIELVMPRSESPAHIHDEDETVVLLGGDVSFRVDGSDVRPDPRGHIVLPAGVAHSYRVESDDARWLSITAGRYEGFVREFGRPLDEAADGSLDLAGAVALTVAAARAGIEIVGPAPDVVPARSGLTLIERLHESLSAPVRWAPAAA